MTAPQPETSAAATATLSSGHRRTDAPAMRQALDEVRHIVESLEQTLEQMEEVL